MLPPVSVPHPHVVVSPDVLGGSPVVEGTRVAVRRLWLWHIRGVTVATLVARYPTLGPAKILSALAFAYDNLPLIEADCEKELALIRGSAVDPSA